MQDKDFSLQGRNKAAYFRVDNTQQLMEFESLRFFFDPSVKGKTLYVSHEVFHTLSNKEIDSIVSVYLTWRFFEAPELPRDERQEFAIELEHNRVAHVAEDKKTVVIRFPIG